MNTRPFRLLSCLICGSMVMTLPFARAASDQVLEIPDTVRIQSSSATEGKVLLRVPWGTAPGEFGKTDEASRPGPMDFAVVGDELYVLDTVNARVQVFSLEGGFKRVIPVETKTADFLCVGPDRNVVVLDAFCRRQLKEFSPSGKFQRSMEVPKSIGLPSALFTDGRSTWLEERHNRVFELSAVDEKPDTSARVVNVLPGRPVLARRGTLHAVRNGERDVLVRVCAADKNDETLAVRFPSRLVSVVALEADASDRVCVAGVCEIQIAEGKAQRRIVAAQVASAGGVTGVVSMPDAYVTDHYRKLRLLDSGDLLQMQTSEEEVRFVRWTLQPAAKGEVSK